MTVGLGLVIKFDLGLKACFSCWIFIFSDSWSGPGHTMFLVGLFSELKKHQLSSTICRLPQYAGYCMSHNYKTWLFEVTMQSVFYNFLNYFCLTLFFIFLDCFNILISKIIFKIKNIILLYFKDKKYFKKQVLLYSRILF